MVQDLSGLTEAEVEERRQRGLDNREVEAPSKSVRQIVASNVLTYFNLVFLIIAILLILVGSYRDLTFLPIIIANTLIGIIQEVRAKQVLDNLKVMNMPRVRTLRDGEEREIGIYELVKDDLVRLGAGNQIPADAVVVEGRVMVNEALLTGGRRDSEEGWRGTIVGDVCGVRRVFGATRAGRGGVVCLKVDSGSEGDEAWRAVRDYSVVE